MHSEKEWLASYFSTNTHNIENVLKNEKATSYLLIWPIMEQYVFNGFLRERDIETTAAKL